MTIYISDVNNVSYADMLMTRLFFCIFFLSAKGFETVKQNLNNPKLVPNDFLKLILKNSKNVMHLTSILQIFTIVCICICICNIVLNIVCCSSCVYVFSLQIST